MFNPDYYSIQLEKPNTRSRYIITGTTNNTVMENIHKFYNSKNKNIIDKFRDGEIKLAFNRSVDGKEVVIVQSTSTPVNDNLIQLFLMITNAKRNGAKRITVIIPYLSQSTQDKNKENVASDVAYLLETSGMDHLILIDGHTEQMFGFFTPRVSCEMLTSFDSCIPTMMTHSPDLFNLDEDLCFVSPDARGIWRIRDFKEKFIQQRRLLNSDLENDLSTEVQATNAII